MVELALCLDDLEARGLNHAVVEVRDCELVAEVHVRFTEHDSELLQEFCLLRVLELGLRDVLLALGAKLLARAREIGVSYRGSL